MDSVVVVISGALVVLLGLLYCVCKNRRPNSAEGPDIEKSLPIKKGQPTIGTLEGPDIEKSSPIKKDRPRIETSEDSRRKEDGGIGSQICEDRPIIFEFERLKIATENFSNHNQLGEGKFASVYKGTLTDGKEIAVKKLFENSMHKEQFLNEAKVLAKLQHKNLVQIIGCCEEGSERLLVFEYMPNNSLDKFLFDLQRSKQLDWRMRFKIILGVARGLVYLHEDSRKLIIHRDIKASNILLDESMEPKIADFGFARQFVEGESHVYSTVVGTPGYIAPEYFMEGMISRKADIYSFGVLLLEIVCGRKITDQNLIGLVWRSFEKRDFVDVFDTVIIDNCEKEEAKKCIHVSLLCIQGDESLRPTMSTVYATLSKSAMTDLQNPTAPRFF